MSSPIGSFITTRWSVVLAARQVGASEASSALEELCGTYWCPLYAHVRRVGFDPDEACDLTQSFFADLLRRDFLRNVGPEKGRFRSFLLACLNHFLSDHRDRAQAAKRGYGVSPVSLDAQLAEDEYRKEPIDELTPEIAYERHWAATLLARAQTRLTEEYTASGKIELLNGLKRFPLAERAAVSFQEGAHQFGMSEGAFKSAVFRMRQRYRELVREEVARTVDNPAEVEEEIRHLITLVRK